MITIAIPFQYTPPGKSVYYYDITKSSSTWEMAIKSVLLPGAFSEMHFLGPKGLPILNCVYVAYRNKEQKRAGDRLLSESGLGQFSDEDLLGFSAHFTLFVRPTSDWQFEMPTKGCA